MAERLFTETQWRAILEVEQRSYDQFSSYVGNHIYRKPIIGPAFVGGRFIIEKTWNALWLVPQPQAPRHAIFELDSRLCLARNASAPSFALEEARSRIERIGEHWGWYLEGEKAAYAEWFAKNAAQKAIYKARTKDRRTTKRAISKRARAVFEASEGKCHYCQTTLTLDGKWHIEHKMPRALFGGSEQDNLAAACIPCNMAKRDKTDLEFAAHLAAQREAI